MEKDVIEIDAGVGALLYRAIRDTERTSRNVTFSGVDSKLDLYMASCNEVKNRDLTSFKADINNAKIILSELKENGNTISEIKEYAKESMGSAVQLAEKQIAEEERYEK